MSSPEPTDSLRAFANPSPTMISPDFIVRSCPRRCLQVEGVCQRRTVGPLRVDDVAADLDAVRVMAATRLTPGIAFTPSMTAGSNVGWAPPVESPKMMSWARRSCLVSCSMLALRELPSALTPVTRAMPIMGVAAVMAVRRGLRAELRRPSFPGRESGQDDPRSWLRW